MIINDESLIRVNSEDFSAPFISNQFKSRVDIVNSQIPIDDAVFILKKIDWLLLATFIEFWKSGIKLV